ncbi:MAG: hypothetical protein KDD47_25450 [Acidobacteria bacterium]|nr:hypothetical protein [Acidobacteriota bacterium]
MPPRLCSLGLLLLTSLPPAWAAKPTPSQLTADTVAVLADPATADGVTVGAYGRCSAPADSSAGAVGETRSASGAVHGVVGRSASPDAPAGRFESTGGGKLLLGGSTSGGNFVVDRTGGISAAAFVGDGSGVVGGAGLVCIGCVGPGDIAPGAITTQHLEAGGITSADIEDGAVTAVKVELGSITTDRIQDGDVTSAKIADRSLDASHILSRTVGSAAIADGALGADKIDDEALSRDKFANSQFGWSTVYFRNRFCTSAFTMELATTCLTDVCGPGPPPQFFTCSGDCTAPTPQNCPNVLAGFLVGD